MCATAAATKTSGLVKWFNAAKGYGFIIPDDGSKELFVHFKQIIATGYKSLNAGDRVIYDVEKNAKGASAVNVIVTTPCGPRATRPAYESNR